MPNHVRIYNGTVVEWGQAQTDIRTALAAHFDYDELMGWYARDEVF